MKFIRKLLTILLICLLFSGCTSAKQYISYTVYPIGYLLNRIGGNKIITTSIQENSLVQVAKMKEDGIDILNDSITLFRIGDLEPYMDLYDEQVGETEVSIQDLAVLNALYKYKRYTPVIVDNKLNFVEGNYYEGEIFDEVDKYDLDPFIWLSPIGMYSMATDVKDYLCSNYFEESEFFTANYDKLADELITLDAAYNSLSLDLISKNQTIKFVSMSGSFGCWQKDYGFQVYPICLSKYGAMPSYDQLQIIKQKIIDDNVKYIVYEPNISDEMRNLLAEIEEELGLKRVTLYNISSLTATQTESGKDYMSLMYENLNILQSMAVPIVEVETTPVEE